MNNELNEEPAGWDEPDPPGMEKAPVWVRLLVFAGGSAVLWSLIAATIVGFLP